MNPEQQRIAIATACGWTELHQARCHYRIEGQSDTYLSGVPPETRELFVGDEPPFYLTDLNAMHAAEKALSHDKRLTYPAYLFQVVCDCAGDEQRSFNRIHPDAWAIQATSKQRAEAFLRCTGRWRDEE
jgi:hypothetical protein